MCHSHLVENTKHHGRNPTGSSPINIEVTHAVISLGQRRVGDVPFASHECNIVWVAVYRTDGATMAFRRRCPPLGRRVRTSLRLHGSGERTANNNSHLQRVARALPRICRAGSACERLCPLPTASMDPREDWPSKAPSHTWRLARGEDGLDILVVSTASAARPTRTVRLCQGGDHWHCTFSGRAGNLEGLLDRMGIARCDQPVTLFRASRAPASLTLSRERGRTRRRVVPAAPL